MADNVGREGQQLPPSFAGDVERAATGRLPRGGGSENGSQPRSPAARATFEMEGGLEDEEYSGSRRRPSHRRHGLGGGGSVGSSVSRSSSDLSRRSSSFVLALTRWFRSLRLPDDIKLPLFLVAILVVFLATWFLREMLIPFIIAILLTYLLRPAVVVIAQSLDYLFSCCGARCCLNLQAKTRAFWRKMWSCTCARGAKCCCPSSSSRKDGGKDDDKDSEKEGKDGNNSKKSYKRAFSASAAARKKKDDELLGGGDSSAASSGVEEALLSKQQRQSPSTSRNNVDVEAGLQKVPSKKKQDGKGEGKGGDDDSEDGKKGEVDPTEFYSVSCSRLIAVLIATALAIGVIAILVLIVVDSIHSFHEKYWDAFSARFDAVMANIVNWIRENLHIDASSLLTSSDKLTKELLGSASTLVSIANAIMVVVVTLLFMMFLLLDERFDGGVGVAAANARRRKRAAEKERLKGLELDLIDAKAKAADAAQRAFHANNSSSDGLWNGGTANNTKDDEASAQAAEAALAVAKLEKSIKHSRERIARYDEEEDYYRSTGKKKPPIQTGSGSSASGDGQQDGSGHAVEAAAAADDDERMWVDIDSAIHRYLIAKTLVSIAMGLLVFIVLGPILKVKLAHLFGVLTIIFNFIPNIGALLAALLPLPIILLDPDLSTSSQVLAILLPLAIHFIIGNFVEPFVLGPLLSLHPVVVLLSLSFWYVLWGVAGAILAVPITSVVAIALKRSNKHSYAAFIVVLLEQFRVDLSLLRKKATDVEDGGSGKGDNDNNNHIQKQHPRGGGGGHGGSRKGGPSGGSGGSGDEPSDSDDDGGDDNNKGRKQPHPSYYQPPQYKSSSSGGAAVPLPPGVRQNNNGSSTTKGTSIAFGSRSGNVTTDDEFGPFQQGQNNNATGASGGAGGNATNSTSSPSSSSSPSPPSQSAAPVPLQDAVAVRMAQ
jgi:predicted PurR-regulated permease PerM